MIWFTCSNCGKKHGRPETSIGSLVFCECGTGNTVPWDSTTEPPAMPSEPVNVPPPPLPPRLEPVPLNEERIPAARPAPQAAQRPRGRGGEYRDPTRCFNHPYLNQEHTCTLCNEHFCGHCVVTFQEKTYCGPCKNYQVRTLNKPPQPSLLAIFALIVGISAGPLGFCLLPFAVTGWIVPFLAFALLFQMFGIALGVLALMRMQQNPLLTGRSLAMTGILSAALGVVLMGVVAVYNYTQWV
jgi:hypothetical protein